MLGPCLVLRSQEYFSCLFQDSTLQVDSNSCCQTSPPAHLYDGLSSQVLPPMWEVITMVIITVVTSCYRPTLELTSMCLVKPEP